MRPLPEHGRQQLRSHAIAPPKILQNLHGKPTMAVGYKTVRQNYGGQVAALLDKLATSKAESVKSFIHQPERLKWEFVIDRADDPRESIRDYEALRGYYMANSHVFLKCIAGGPGAGGKFVGVEPLDAIPPNIAALFEQRARLLAEKRSEADEPEEPIAQAASNGDLGGFPGLEQWLSSHPNQKLASLARQAIELLMESD